MKNGVLYGLATLAVGVIVASLGGAKKDKPSTTYKNSVSYWK
jgi:hypothetical protein